MSNFEFENVPFALSNQNRRSLDARVGKVEIFDQDFELVDTLYGNFIRCNPGVTKVTFDESIQDGFTATLHNVTNNSIDIPVARDLPAGSSLELQRVAGEWRTVGGTAEVPEAGFKIEPISDQAADILLTPDDKTAAFVDDPDFSIKYEGDGAVTFGKRTPNFDVGKASLVIALDDYDPDSDDLPTAAKGETCLMVGAGNVIEPFPSPGFATSSGVVGNGNTIDGEFGTFIIGGNNKTNTFGYNLIAGFGNEISGASVFGCGIIGTRNTIKSGSGSANSILGDENSINGGPGGNAVFGTLNDTSGSGAALVAGARNTLNGGSGVNGNYTTVLGDNNTVDDGYASLTTGRLCQLQGARFSLMAGQNNTATVNHTFTVGRGNQNDGGFAAITGRGNTASGNHVFIGGRGHKAGSDSQASFGKFSVDYTADANTSPILQVGIGADASNREDALLIEQDGTISTKDENVVITADGDVEINDPTKGIILTSPDGTKFRQTVDNNGNIVMTQI